MFTEQKIDGTEILIKHNQISYVVSQSWVKQFVALAGGQEAFRAQLEPFLEATFGDEAHIVFNVDNSIYYVEWGPAGAWGR